MLPSPHSLWVFSREENCLPEELQGVDLSAEMPGCWLGGSSGDVQRSNLGPSNAQTGRPLLLVRHHFFISSKDVHEGLRL